MGVVSSFFVRNVCFKLEAFPLESHHKMGKISVIVVVIFIGMYVRPSVGLSAGK